MSENENTPSPEYLASVLNVTREQLTRAMGICAELEALVNAERARNQQLEELVVQLTSKLEKPGDAKDAK